MAHRGIDNFGPLVFRARAWGQISISRRGDKAAADTTHGLTSSHGNVINKRFNYNCIFPRQNRLIGLGKP
jgi:hypothetical protein